MPAEGIKPRIDHSLMRVRLKQTQELFAIDLTGSQYGHFKVITPWQTYLTERCSNVRLEVPLGKLSYKTCTKSAVPECFVRYDDMHEFNSKRLQIVMQSWLRENNYTTRDFLNLKASSFEKGLAGLLKYATDNLNETRDMVKQCGDLLLESMSCSKDPEKCRKLLRRRAELLEQVGIEKMTLPIFKPK